MLESCANRAGDGESRQTNEQTASPADGGPNTGVCLDMRVRWGMKVLLVFALGVRGHYTDGFPCEAVADQVRRCVEGRCKVIEHPDYCFCHVLTSVSVVVTEERSAGIPPSL